MAQLKRDPAWAAQQEEKQRSRRLKEADNRANELPVVDDLKAAGVEVNSVWDLVNRRAPYEALPILVEHLRRVYPIRVREGIARALATRDAHAWWSSLVAAFKEAPARNSGSDLRWALGLAVGVSAKVGNASELAALLRDRSYGEDRIALLHGALKSGGPLTQMLQREFGTDPDLAGEFGGGTQKSPPRKSTGLTLGVDRREFSKVLLELEKEGVVIGSAGPKLAAAVDELGVGKEFAFDLEGSSGRIHLSVLAIDSDAIEMSLESTAKARASLKRVVERVLG